MTVATPDEFYHRLRRRYAPTFEPRKDIEAPYWETFSQICAANNWDPYETIERVFQFIAWKLSGDQNIPASFKKGYPTLSQLVDINLITASYLAEQASAQRENPFRFTSYAESALASQLQLLRTQALNNNETLTIAAGKYRHLPVWAIVRLAISPTLRKKSFKPAQIKQILDSAKDPTLWTAMTKAGIAKKDIEETKLLVEQLQQANPPTTSKPE